MGIQRVKTKPFALDREQYLRFHLRQFRPKILRNTIPFAILAMYLLIAVVGLAWYGAAITVAVAFGLGILVQPTLMRRVLRRPIFDAGFSERTAEFSVTEYFYTDEDSVERSMPLNAFVSARVSDGFYVLAISPAQNVLIPADAFASDAEGQAFQGFLKANIPDTSGF